MTLVSKDKSEFLDIADIFKTQYKDDWSYNYLVSDIQKYWNENNLWDEFPFQFLLSQSLDNKLNYVGGVGVTYVDNEVHIKRVFTRCDCRGLGFGTKLIELVWETAWDKGYRYLRMWCDKKAIPFYKKLGFTILGEKNNYGFVYSPIFTKNIYKSLNIGAALKSDYLYDDDTLKKILKEYKL